MSLLDNLLVGFTTPPAQPGEASVAKSTEKEAIAQNPVMMAYQRMSMEAGLRRPQGITFATLRRMSRVNWVDQACIKTLRDEISGLPWDIVPIDTKKPYNENLKRFLVLLLMQPNQNKESWRTLIDKVIEDILVVDAGTLEKVRDQKGRIAELYYIDGATIKPVYDIKGMLGDPNAYEQYLPTPTASLPVATFSKWDLIRMQWNPVGTIDNFGWGMSPVEAGLAVATAFLNAEAYNMSFFQRNTIPPVVINLGEDVPDTEVTTFRAYLAAEMQGQQGFWQPFAMSGGKGFDIKELLKAPKDMAWKEYVEWQMRWKVALYRMSPQDIGFNLDQYKIQGDTQMQLSKNKAIRSLQDVIEGYINNEIISDPGWGISPLDINLKFQWIDTETIDPLDQAQIDKIYWSMGIYEGNYIRQERFGLDPIEGGRVPFIIQGSQAFALSPKLLNEAEGIQEESEEGDGTEENQEEEDVSKSMVRKVFSPQEGLITDLSLNGTAIAWMDDRGVTQPLFITDFGKKYGYTIKPDFLDVRRDQEPPEAEVAHIMRSLSANTPQVEIMSYDDVLKLLPAHLYGDFTKWNNVEAPYNSMEWRQRWGSTRKSEKYIVTGFITGKDLNNKELQASMKTNPDMYKKAIQDFARIWLVEKRFYLGDRKPGHYIITEDGNGFGVDYQFFNTESSWKKTSKWLPATLLELNKDLYDYFIQCLVKEYNSMKNLEKAFRYRPKAWTPIHQQAELEKKIGKEVQDRILTWYRHSVNVKKNFNSLPVRKSTAFDPELPYITDGEYVWQNGINYPMSVLQEYVNTWFDPQDQSLQPFIQNAQKLGLGLAQIAFGTLLLLSANDYSPAVSVGQEAAISQLKALLPTGTRILPPVSDASTYSDRVDFLAATMSQSLKDSIDAILQKAVADNLTYGQIHDSILTTLGIDPNNPTAIGWRAERIAKTETMWAIRESALQQFEAQGITMFDLINQPEACPICTAIAQDNPYPLADAKAIGNGSLHPNCYCTWAADTEQFNKAMIDEATENYFTKGWVTMGGKHIFFPDTGGGHGGGRTGGSANETGATGGGSTKPTMTGHSPYEKFNDYSSKNSAEIKKFEESNKTSGLTKEESASIKEYQGPTSMFVNGTLRGNLPDGYKAAVPQFHVNEHVQNLDSAINKSTLNQDVALYHGGKFPEGLQVGDQFTDKGYFSTSILEGSANGFMDKSKGEGMATIYAPTGTKALVVNANVSKGGFNDYTDEHEVLLPRNSTFQVVSVRTINSSRGSYKQYELSVVK